MTVLLIRTVPLTAALLLLLVCESRADDQPPGIEEVRRLLRPGAGGHVLLDDNGKRLSPDPLLKWGDRLFPTCAAIIADPKSNRAIVDNAMGRVSQIKGNRKRFIPLAVERLTDPLSSVRGSAVRLLGEIGSERDTAPIVALLSDEDTGVRRDAARTLAKIGGKNDVIAMDIWLKVGNHRNDGDHMRLVKKCRDELEKRLKKNPVLKGFIDGLP